MKRGKAILPAWLLWMALFTGMGLAAWQSYKHGSMPDFEQTIRKQVELRTQ